MDVLIRELAAFYASYTTKKSAPLSAQLSALPIQYSDFAHWQRTWLEGAGADGESPLERQLAYWRRQLADLPTLELPTDYERPAVQSYRGASRAFTIPAPLTEALKALSRQEQTTLFMILLAAFQALLAHYSGQTDIVVGTRIAGRTRSETRPLIGFFVNALVLRADLSGDPTARELLRQVREGTLGAYAHQDLPFEKLVEELHPQRDLSRNPLFQVMFVLNNFPFPTIELPGVTIQPIPIEAQTAKFDLDLAMGEVGGVLNGVLEYNTDVFADETIERMLAHFKTLLAGMAAHADQPLARLPLMDADERQQVLHTWNDTAAPYPHNTHLAALFAAQVGRSPDAIALVEGEVQLSYAALARQAHQLAHALQGCGVGPEVVVALALPRSLLSVVALLAIYAAGGAVVPLDPSHPAAHLAAILADTQPAVILTAARFLAALPECPAQVLCLDADATHIASYPSSVPPTSVSASHLAHIVYTSGSTGVPKGVAVPQRQLLHRLAWAAHAHPLCPSDRVALRTAPSFSVAFAELLNPLLQGATAVLLPDPDAYDSPRLLAALHHHALSHLILVPTLLRALLDALDAEERPLPLLRVLVVCGEVLPPDLVRRAQTHMPATCLLHQYGASEVNDVTLYNATTLPAQAGRVPLGSPISNMQVYLLDQHLQPVPIGLPGLLYVGGLGLARGYHNRPDLTAERFVPCPWSVVSGQLQRTTDNGPLTTDNRLYAMGDLARWRADGRLEYLGRKDQQVKLRGVRVDLAGIEALLRAQGGVAQAAALLRNPEAGKGAEGDGTARLLAYVAPQEGVLLDGRALRRVLAARLPSGQVPEQVLVLPELPRTPSGKLARRALAELAPEVAPEPGTTTEAGPRTPLEELVGRIWASVLGREAVGRDDNFFELGGHSLLATQVVARVREVCGVELPLRVLFEAPTLAELTEQIAALRSEGVALVLPPITPVARTGAEPLSFAQQRLWFLEQLHPGYPFYNVPAALRLTGPLRVEALRASLGAVIARHEVLRTRFEVLDGHPVQVIAPPSASSPPEPTLPIVDLHSHAPEAREPEALRLATAEAQRPFDLVRGPLLRATLLKLDANDYVLLLTLHHTIADGWSTAVLVRELTAHYAALSAPLSAPPVGQSALPIQYADFAHWQRRWLHGAGDGGESPLQRQLAYWRRQLADLPTLDLPTDYARPAKLTFHGATSTFTIPAALRDQLNALNRREGVTLFMTLLAAFQVVLSRYSRQTDLVVGSPIANRRWESIEPLIGCFVNTLVLRGDLSGNPTFQELLRRVREVCLGAYAHQDLPFEQLVEALQPQRDLSRQPLFQVLFILQNMTMPELVVADLAVRPLKIDRGTATFELALNLLETPEGLVGEVEYRTDLFAATTIERMVAHLRMVLEAAIADPRRRLSDLPLLPPDERQDLLATWNATGRDYSLEVPLHQLLDAQAARTPDAVALVFDHQEPRTKNQEPRTKNQEPSGEDSGSQFSVLGSGQGSQFSYVTYATLNRRANQLAHHLRALGVGPDVLVGICMERSLDLVVALLAVLKAGGAYLPLDPSYPAERLAFMLEDAQVAVLLTNQEQRTKSQEQRTTDRKGVLHTPPADPGLPTVIDLISEWPTIARQPATNLDSSATADNLAYTIYTSGSTGQPKGAMNTHRAIVNRLLWMQETYQLAPTDRVLQKTPFSFDVSVWEFFWPLLTGATLVLARPGGHQDPAYLIELIRQQRITTLHFVPAMLRVFLEAPGVERCGIPTQGGAGLRRVICSGEELTRALVERCFDRLGAHGVELHNLYGPTEAAVDVTAWACQPADGADRVPIGHPVANTQIYILDEQLQPAPIGVAGELYIGGVQLARGYLGRPDLTAERFIPNPFTGERLEIRDWRLSGAQSPISNLQSPISNRLYRTGDLCRYREDGAIEYLGRTDTQVKLRGYRIELGEIEAALSAHPAVRAAVVALREDRPSEKRLVAYVVASQLQPAENKEQRTKNKEGTSDNGQLTTDNGLLADELRAFLKQRLPEYMLPAAFVLLDALPLTPSGKLDRRALPAMAAEAPARAVLAPRTAAEARLVEQWRELLGVAEVSVEDNFFVLGGHSLLLTQLAFRIPELFGVQVPLRALFDAPTVVAMTVVIAAHQAEREDQAAIAQELEELRHLSPDEVKALLAAEEWS